MKIKELITILENWAPKVYAEDYDNVGLLTGNAGDEISSVLCTLDCTEDVVDEAIQHGCNLIVAHHPIVFKGLKKLTGKTYVERTIIKAIKNNISIYAIHTNLDHVHTGVNAKIANVIGLNNTRILKPLVNRLYKLVVFVPQSDLQKVEGTMFEAGAGNIGNYSECSFHTNGTGAYKANDLANPTLGQKQIRHFEPELRLEVLVPVHALANVISAMKAAHSYEEVAYDILPMTNPNTLVGAGMIGELATETDAEQFLKELKAKFNTTIRYTGLCKKKVRKIALCGGSGSFLLGDAIASGADVFITGDFKYHEFFDADNQIIIMDIGHFESEQFTRQLLKDYIENSIKNIATFAVRLSGVDTNPIKYY